MISINVPNIQNHLLILMTHDLVSGHYQVYNDYIITVRPENPENLLEISFDPVLWIIRADDSVQGTFENRNMSGVRFGFRQ